MTTITHLLAFISALGC